MWMIFLYHPSVFARPFLDVSSKREATIVGLVSDASANPNLGCGGMCEGSWYFKQWDPQFIIEKNPSIEYLELYAVTVGIVNWLHRYSNRRIILHCDNMSVVYMINSNTSSCKNCMYLIRLIVLESLCRNVRVYAKHITSKDNLNSDLLSRMKIQQFRLLNIGKIDCDPTPIPGVLWPMDKIWLDSNFRKTQKKEVI